MFSINGDDILFNGVLVGKLIDTQPISVRIEAEHVLVDGLSDKDRKDVYDEGHGDGYAECDKEWLSEPGYEEGRNDGYDAGYEAGYEKALDSQGVK